METETRDGKHSVDKAEETEWHNLGWCGKGIENPHPGVQRSEIETRSTICKLVTLPQNFYPTGVL